MTAVVYCDLDGFKAVNDTHGHAAGDRVLCHVAQQLLSVTRADDTVGRLGGDEFVVVVQAAGPDELTRVTASLAERVREVLQRPLADSVHGVHGAIDVSIGLAVAGPGAEPEDLLHRADQAMYAAKAGRVERRRN